MATQKKQAKKPANTKISTKKPNPKQSASKKTFIFKFFIIAFLVMLCAAIFVYKTTNLPKIDKPKISEQNVTLQKQIEPKKPKKDMDILKEVDIKFDDNISIKKDLDENKSKIDTDEISYDDIVNNLDKFAPTKNINILKPSGKPKLAIIIDDVSTFAHVKSIKDTKVSLTPSIFPLDKYHKDALEIARNFDFYMIHLPTEAIKFNSPKIQTLTTKDSYENIDNKIAFIRENFKDAKFINNHTGSKFTSDEASMERLLKALDKYGFTFIDSKTISDTKTEKLAPKYSMRYIYRDVFLDNKDDVAYIKNQLKKAVNISKVRGFAIAIGHPKDSTFKAIKSAKKDILDDVEVVYVSEIYEYYK